MTFTTFLPAVLEAAKTGGKGGGAGMLVTFLPFLLIIGVLYFFSIRPQKKREKELRSKLEAMRPGDEVMTIGGILGRVANITDDEVTIYTSVANTMMTFKKNAISTVVSPHDTVEPAPAKDKKKKKDKED